MKLNLILIVLVGLTLAATVYVAASLGAPAVVGASGAGGDRLAAIEERLANLERLAIETRDDARRAARAGGSRRGAAPAAAGSAAVAAETAFDGDVAAAMSSSDLKQVVADSVKNTVAEQMERIAAQKRNRGSDGKWKPPMDEVAKTLELTEAQRGSLERVFDGARDESFALLRTQRADGGNLLDDFARDLRENEGQKQPWMRFFGALSTQPVPGRNQTYLEALGEAETRVRERVNANLDDRQRRTFESLNVDVFDVKTGHDPVGDYIRQALGSDAR